jgi:hypothetical protein
LERDWAAELRKTASVLITATQILVTDIHVTVDAPLPEGVAAMITEQSIVGNDSGSSTLRALAYSTKNGPEVEAKTSPFFASNPLGVFNVNMELAGWWIELNGVRYPIKKAVATLRREHHEGAIDLTHAGYTDGGIGEAAVAYGRGQVGGFVFNIVRTDRPGHPGTSVITVGVPEPRPSD